MQISKLEDFVYKIIHYAKTNKYMYKTQKRYKNKIGKLWQEMKPGDSVRLK